MTNLIKIISCAVLSIFFVSFAYSTVSAANLANFRASNIIDDGVFSNKATMTVPEIQNFLNSKMPNCDINGAEPSEYGGGTRAQYGASRGNPAPFTCLKDYWQNTITGGDNYGGQPVPAGAVSAAQIIWNYSQQFNINPQVILVTLQKENGMITDEWPFLKQYREAMGFGCPDNVAPGAPACDPAFGSFSAQIYEAARHFRNYMDRQYCDVNWCTPYTVGNRYVAYNPNASCGGTTISIETRATGALYSYTPYQPNAASLAAGYGTGDGCSSYGNRNFYSYFNDWFGPTYNTVPYKWEYVSQEAFVNAGRTTPFTSVPTTTPGGKVYLRVRALNVGNQTWQNTSMRLGTSRPMDHASIHFTADWISNNRATSLVETSVSPGQIGTFEFSMQSPGTLGTYSEYFNLLVEGREWLNDPGLYFTVNVNNSANPSAQANPTLNSGQSLSGSQYLLSTDLQSTLAVSRDGSATLYTNFQPSWIAPSGGNRNTRLVMQLDGNLVLYSQNGLPLWNSQTQGNPGARLVLQSDGNLVIYSPSNVPLYASYTLHTPVLLSYVNTTLSKGFLYPFQKLETASRNYRLLLQPDGNLVLYTADNRAVWASGTDGSEVSFLALQPDGNLVLYDKEYRPLWNSFTAGTGSTNRLIMQPDGNLVLYTRENRPVWASGTVNR